MPGSRISDGSEEKKGSQSEGLATLRHFCHLSCFVVRDCHSPLSFVLHFVLMPVWLKANQSVCTSWEFVGVHSDEKGFH